MKTQNIKTIRDVQEFLNQIYPNSQRDFSYIFGYAARHQGYLSKGLTKREETRVQFIKTASWLFALGSHLDINLQEALFERHPGVCPYCLADRCVCIITGKIPSDGTPAHKVGERLKSKATLLLLEDKQGLGDHAKRINYIYPGNRNTHSVIGAWQLAAKLQEELAEVHEASTRHLDKRKPKSAVAEELSDLFAWLLASWDIVYPSTDFQGELISFYKTGCPECSSDDSGDVKPCSCNVHADQTSQLVDSSKLLEIDGLLIDLAKAAGADSGPASARVNDVRKSLAAAIKSQSEPIARTAAHQAVTLAENLEDKLEKGAKNAGNAVKIVGAVRTMVEALPFW